MTETLSTQADVDAVARELAPEVVRVRMNISQDWSADPAIYFRVILSDQASRTNRLAEVTGKVSGKLFDDLGLAALEHIPYFKFRSESEQIALQDKAWD